LHSVSKAFLSKLRNAVILSRRKKFKREEIIRQEEINQEARASSKAKEKAMDTLRARLYALEHNRYYCIRPQVPLLTYNKI
jgi:hypothetical protein